MVDKYYYVKGGAERYVFELTDVLHTKGHEVIPFAMKDQRNFSTPYDKYFVDNIEFNLNNPVEKVRNAFKISGRIIYSKHAQEKIETLIEKTKPDIAHIHMIDHQISPSILVTLKKHNIPIIQTVHQYKLVCPNYRLYIERKNEICEKCLGSRFYHPILEKCHKNSYLASFLVSVESYLHKMFHLYENIDIFHVPSQFLGSKLKEAGINEEKVRHQFYAINISEYNYQEKFKDYFLYYGRLSREKGLFTLLKAMKEISNSSIKLYVVGEGPLHPELEKITREWNLNNVIYLGFKSGNELKRIVSNARFTVVPSEWYDNSPLVIYESFALGTPVIGAKLGGIPELVDDGLNGLLFTARDVKELVEKIKTLYSSISQIKIFGRNARKKAEKCFSWETNYKNMIDFYDEIKR